MTRRSRCFYRIRLGYSEASALTGIILVILIVPLILSIQNFQMAGYLIEHTDYGLYSMFQAVKVEYVAANETSQEIFFKLHNYGTLSATIEKVLVNDAEATMMTSLPLTLGSYVDYGTIVFKYNGSWEDSIQVTMLTDHGVVYGEGVDIKQSVNLQDASQNSVISVYPSESESQKAYQMQHRWEILRTSLAEICILTPSIMGLAAFFVYTRYNHIV